MPKTQRSPVTLKDIAEHTGLSIMTVSRVVRGRPVVDLDFLINVLYTLDDPERCLREVHELLRPGGVLVLSTPHSETDVDQLFDHMAKVLTRKGLFPRLQSNYDDARRRHEEMMDSIHRDTKDDIRGYLQRAGFIIREWRSAYVDAVVIVEAVRDG